MGLVLVGLRCLEMNPKMVHLNPTSRWILTSYATRQSTLPASAPTRYVFGMFAKHARLGIQTTPMNPTNPTNRVNELDVSA